MSKAVRLTMAQALVRYLCAQRTRYDGEELPLFSGLFAIFGHGNVAGMGEALEHSRDRLPVYRAHNEQGMAHAAIAYAKATRRRRMMACTTSVGPGATNMVTAAALAHVNRLPVLFLPGDTFASRLPDPVLQQLEVPADPTASVNDCFRPVSRFWDRISRPEQLLHSLPQAMAVLTDAEQCGPVTLALPQDVQAEAWDYPETFFEPCLRLPVRSRPDTNQLDRAVHLISQSLRPVIIAGGGVHYSGAADELARLAEAFHIPVAETQAGKSALPWDHPANVGAVGVTGSRAANQLLADADLVIAVGTRLQDFTTGSGMLLARPECPVLSINVALQDIGKFAAQPLRGDALCCLRALTESLADYLPAPDWVERSQQLREEWNRDVSGATQVAGTARAADESLPGDAQVLGVVNRHYASGATVVCAAGGLPGELHKLWRASDSDSYHVEYGYSCMGYEIAGGLGVKLAHPERDVVVMVGDGSYLMLNSEIATSVAYGQKLVIVVLDNRGFGCINRLQASVGGTAYNNLWDSSYPLSAPKVHVDFAAHAAALGAHAEKVAGIADLDAALERADASDRTSVVVIDTDPQRSTEEGGCWWDVPVPEVSVSSDVRQAADAYRRRKSDR